MILIDFTIGHFGCRKFINTGAPRIDFRVQGSSGINSMDDFTWFYHLLFWVGYELAVWALWDHLRSSGPWNHLFPHKVVFTSGHFGYGIYITPQMGRLQGPSANKITPLYKSFISPSTGFYQWLFWVQEFTSTPTWGRLQASGANCVSTVESPPLHEITYFPINWFLPMVILGGDFTSTPTWGSQCERNYPMKTFIPPSAGFYQWFFWVHVHPSLHE